MIEIIDILEALFSFYVGWSCFNYYRGRMRLQEEKENRRKRIVEKYGWLLIIVITLSSLLGLVLLVSAIDTIITA